MQNFIRERREKLGINQGELADRLREAGLEVTRAAVSHWETGRHPSPFDNVRDILILAQVLGIELSEILRSAKSELAESELSKAAQTAARIVDGLAPAAQQIALEQLRALQKYFPEK
jgi:transcriptional regulator with XRE-family HTH domain